MTRRRVLASASAATAIGLAGCSGILGGDGGNGSDGENGGGEFTQEDMGSVASNEVAELEIVGWTSDVGEDSFDVTATIRNDGGESTRLVGYGYEVTFYDGSGSAIGSGSDDAESDPTVESGETAEVPLTSIALVDPSNVERYDIALRCDDFADGVYCE